MKLPLKHFLVICLLLGGVAVPAGFWWYKSWKTREVERLERKLDDLWANEPVDETAGYLMELSGTPFGEIKVRVALGPDHEKWKADRESLEARIEDLSGQRPTKKQSKIEPLELTGRKAWNLGVPTGVPGERVFKYSSRPNPPME